MIECKICKKISKSLLGLTTHLKHQKGKNNHPKEIKDYYDLYLKKEDEGICQNPECLNDFPITTTSCTAPCIP